MAITDFADGIEVGLNAIQNDLLAKSLADKAAGLRTDTFEDDDGTKEDCQVLAIAYVLVRALYARQKTDPDTVARDRLFGRWIGGEAQYAFYRLIEMLQPVYQEFITAANDNDDAADSPFEVGYADTAGGPKGGQTS